MTHAQKQLAALAAKIAAALVAAAKNNATPVACYIL